MSANKLIVTNNRLLIPMGLTLLGLAALVVALLVVISPFGAGIAHGSGTGGGGCISTSGPSCGFKNVAASAQFGSVSNDGCIFTDAFIQPFQTLTRPGNMTSQAVFVFVGKFDRCQGIQLESAANFDPSTGAPDFTGTVQLDTRLSSASVNGTAPMFDTTTGALLFTANINVTWQGFGSATRNIDSSHIHGPGFIVNSHFNGESRAAEASGTLTDETGANVAAPASLNAELDNATSGTVQITKS